MGCHADALGSVAGSAAEKRRLTAPTRAAEHEDKNNRAERPARRPLEVEGDAVERQLNPPRFEPTPVKALKPLPLAQFGETGLDDRLAAPVSGARQRMAEQLGHPSPEFLAVVALARTTTR